MANDVPMADRELTASLASFTDELRTLASRLDPGQGWYAAFARRSRAELEDWLAGRELPPWDIIADLLQDLAVGHGLAAAERTGWRIRERYETAARAQDALPDGHTTLARRLGALDHAEREVRQRARLLAGAEDRAREVGDARETERMAALRLWAEDDEERIQTRRAELKARLAAARGGATRDEERQAAAAAPATAAREQLRVREQVPAGAPGGAPGPATVAGGPEPATAQAAHADGATAYATAPRPRHPDETGHGPTAPPAPPAGVTGAAGVTAPRPRAPMDDERHPVADRGPTMRPPVPPTPPAPPAQGSVPGPRIPADGQPPRASGPPDAPAYEERTAPDMFTPRSGRPSPRTPMDGAGPPSADRAPDGGRVRGARFAGLDEASAFRPAAPPPAPPAGTEGRAGRSSGGSRFAGGSRFGGGTRESRRQREARLLEEEQRAVIDVTERLRRLRGEGQSGAAHIVLCEAASGPPSRLPLLAAELERAGMGADLATLLWEAASLPPGELAAAAEALATAGRDRDCEQLLRQGAARPAAEAGAIAAALSSAGHPNAAVSLLTALVRARTAEDAATAAADQPEVVAPLLLDAARRVSPSHHFAVTSELRRAGVA